MLADALEAEAQSLTPHSKFVTPIVGEPGDTMIQDWDPVDPTGVRIRNALRHHFDWDGQFTWNMLLKWAEHQRVEAGYRMWFLPKDQAVIDQMLRDGDISESTLRTVEQFTLIRMIGIKAMVYLHELLVEMGLVPR